VTRQGYGEILVKRLSGQPEEMIDQDMAHEMKGRLLIVDDDPFARLTLDALEDRPDPRDLPRWSP
jgi:hypothetical protein